MSRTSIKKLLRDSVNAAFVTQAGAEITGVQVVNALEGDRLNQTHIRIVTSSAEPQIAGETNLGRWDVLVNIDVVSNIDDTTGDEHDDLVGLVEDFALQGNKALAALFTTAAVKVDNVMPGGSTELAIGGMIYSGQEISCECYKL